MFVEGIEPEHIASYQEHYAGVDPWMDLMEATRHGQIRNTEGSQPSASFRNSEFYSDWLSRQENLKAATGIRIDVDASNAIIICLHYSVEQASLMDARAEAMLHQLKPALIDAVRSAAMLRCGLEQSPRLGSLIERIAGGALLIDGQRRIHEASLEAVAAMESGQIYSGAGNVLVVRDPVAQRWLEEAINQQLTRQQPHGATATFMTDNQVYRINITRSSNYGGPNFDFLVHPQPRILVVIRLLTAGSLRLDAEALRLSYGLTDAESKLCEILANGYSLVESARRLQISEGTVRQRTKAVFLKTGTHRQGELIARVTHFVAD